MAWSIKTFRALTADATAANLNQIRTNLNTHLRLHAHTAVAGDGGTLLVAQDYVQIFPFFSTSNTNWGTRVQASARLGGYLETTTSAQNNAVFWKVALRAGTWRIDLLHRKASNYGIITAAFNGVTAGTIDLYAAGSSNDNESSITGITLAGSNVNSSYTLSFTMATKNASSSAYAAGVQFIALRRTGA